MIISNAETSLQQIFLEQDLSLPEVITRYKQFNNSCTKKEVVRETSACWRCGTKHFLNSCPTCGKVGRTSDDVHNPKEQGKHVEDKQRDRRFVCSKCGTYHPFRECPAHGQQCSNCYERGHYASHCPVQRRSIPRPSLPLVETTMVQIEDCLWCGSKHPPEQCKHDAACPMCSKYPHNICFYCRENPHIYNCIFKDSLTLPPKGGIQQPVVKLEDCLWCESKHLPGLCKHNAACPMCDDYSHNICFNCRENPHTDDCIFKDSIALPLKKEVQSQVVYQLEDCSWCGTKHHPQGQCLHDLNCTTCTHFPHNICFQCRENPHTESCIFKDEIELPAREQVEE